MVNVNQSLTLIARAKEVLCKFIAKDNTDEGEDNFQIIGDALSLLDDAEAALAE